MQDASDLYNADYAQTEELFRRLLSSSAGACCLLGMTAGECLLRLLRWPTTPTRVLLNGS